MKTTQTSFQSPVGRDCTDHGPTKRKKHWLTRQMSYTGPDYKEPNVVLILMIWAIVFLGRGVINLAGGRV